MLKKNLIYNIVLTVSGFVINFITFPYITRVLGVTNIGVVNFIDGIVNYGILLSMLGVSAVGIREVAKNKHDESSLNNTFFEVLAFNALFTIISIITLWVLIFLIPSLYTFKEFLYLGIVKILFNFLLIEWFFKGLENFKYITIRSLLIKLLSCFAVFVFIKQASDIYLYYLLSVLTVVVNSCFNWGYLFRIHNFKVLSKVNVFRHSSSIFVLGFYLALTSMYTTFNIVYLGFVGGETEVGYYSTSIKLYSVFLALYTAFTGVMLPRMSYLFDSGNLEIFKGMILKSINALFIFSFPVITFTLVFAPEIIELIAGPGFEGAILPMRIIMPLLFIIGYEQILVVQSLVPMKLDKKITINSTIGAVLSITLNLLIVPLFFSVGSALVWVICELIILILSQIVVTNQIKLSFPFKLLIRNILYALPMIPLCLFIQNLSISIYLKLFISSANLFFYYFLILFYVEKDSLFRSIVMSVLAFKRKLS